MLESVPFIIGEGAEVSVDVIRNFAYQALGRAEGIGKPGDLKVSATPAPTAEVAWAYGSAAILNRSDGGDGQMYTALNRPGTPEIRTEIPATGAAGPRSDLLVIRVEDPQYDPWQPYTDPGQIQFGPYVFPRRIPNVGAGITSARQLGGEYATQSMYAVARIDMPANTTVVLPQYIKDLRKVAQAQSDRDLSMYSPTSPQYSPANGSPRGWFPKLDQLVYCPEWATKMRMVVNLGNIKAEGIYTGSVRAEYGWGPGEEINPADPQGLPCLSTQYAGYHTDTGTDRQTIVIADTLAVPASYRGKSHYVRTGTISNGGYSGRLVADTWSNITVDIEFEEAAV